MPSRNRRMVLTGAACVALGSAWIVIMLVLRLYATLALSVPIWSMTGRVVELGNALLARFGIVSSDPLLGISASGAACTVLCALVAAIGWAISYRLRVSPAG